MMIALVLRTDDNPLPTPAIKSPPTRGLDLQCKGAIGQEQKVQSGRWGKRGSCSSKRHTEFLRSSDDRRWPGRAGRR